MNLYLVAALAGLVFLSTMAAVACWLMLGEVTKMRGLLASARALSEKNQDQSTASTKFQEVLLQRRLLAAFEPDIRRLREFREARCRNSRLPPSEFARWLCERAREL